MQVLILFAHPALEKSRVHRRLAQAAAGLPGITFHDLYETYPNFQIDISREQAQLLAHDLIVLQHPIYWYSVPPLLKQWFDLVLAHGWAYGSTGTALRGKRAMSALSTGGPAQSYTPDGFHGHTLGEFLLPIERTITLCKMEYLPPFVVHGTHRLTEPEIAAAAAAYARLLADLRDTPAEQLASVAP